MVTLVVALIGALLGPIWTAHAGDLIAGDDTPSAELTATPVIPPPNATQPATSTPPPPTSTAIATLPPTDTATPRPTETATPPSSVAPTQTVAATPTNLATPTATPIETPPASRTAEPTEDQMLRIPASTTAWVEEGAPDTSHPASETLAVGGSPQNRAFFLFEVDGIDHRPIESATLRVWSIEGSLDGPAVYPVDPNWAAHDVTWSHQPVLLGWSPDDRGSVDGGAWVEWNVRGLVPGDGSVALGLQSSSADAVVLAGIGGVGSETAPQLVLTLGEGTTVPTPISTTVATGTSTVSPPSTAALTPTAVQGTPEVQLSPVKGKFNDVISVGLTGFTPGSLVTVRWQDGTTLTTATAASNGTATASFRTPLLPYGDYRVEARDAAGRTAQATLRIIPRVNLAPTSGPAGSTTRVYLYGYAAGERVEVRWYDTSTAYRVLTTLTIASNGRASQVVTVPAGASLGQHKVMGKVIGVSRSASLPFTVTAGGAGDEGTTTVGPNPFADTALYVRPDSPAKRQADGWRASRPTDAAAMDRLASQPTADWLGPWDPSIRASVDDRVSRATAVGRLPVLVAYNLGMNPCANTGAQAPDAYKAWIRAFASGIGTRSAVVILEPDALAMIGCMSGAAYDTRMLLFRDAVRVLDARPGVTTYIDAGHSNWTSPSDMAARLRSAGVGRTQGFSLNVSNFGWTSSNAAYGRDLSARLGGKHFVIDTSRNGVGPAPGGEWCNPDGRAVGPAPTAADWRHPDRCLPLGQATGRVRRDVQWWPRGRSLVGGVCARPRSAGLLVERRHLLKANR
jgi:endoglucanase